MPTTFRDLIAANERASFWLVAGFVLFTGAVALVIVLAIVAYVSPSVVAQLDWGRSLGLGAIAFAVAFGISVLGYYGGEQLVLGVSGARELPPGADPELRNVVEEMAIAAGVPVPKIYLINDSAPNAFATGRDPKHAIVAITTGLRAKLTRAELQGVMAHEMAHVRNYDIRLMLLMAVLIGTVVMLSDLLWQVLRFSSPGSRRSRDSKGGGNAVVIVLVVVAVILSVIAPILAQLIPLAVSREREYLADATAVELTRYPEGLASALRKIDADPDVLETANRGTAHLYIANPIKKFEARANSMFSSHPPIQERVRRLEALARTPDFAAAAGPRSV